MPFLEGLLKRWGFVKLSRYGLTLTPEGRIISMRPMVLDDGGHRPVVGWRDRDLAAAELERWPALPAPAVATAAPVAAPRPVPVAVAPAPQVDEDEWEWTIALARARTAAEEATAAARAAATSLPLLAPRDSAEWPVTAPVGGTIDYGDYTDPAAERTRPAARRVQAPTTQSRMGSRSTVIPVPALPHSEVTAIRAVPPPVPVTARRLAKGTGPVIDATMEPTAVGLAPAPPRPPVTATAVAPMPPASLDPTAVGLTPAPPRTIDKIDKISKIAPSASDDRTVPGAPALLVGDRTSPGITALPSIRSRSLR